MIARMRNADLDLPIDGEILAALRHSATESVDWLLASIEEGETWTPVLPPGVATQIQWAARRGVSLENVLAGYAVIANVVFEFLANEVGDLPRSQDVMRYAVSMQKWNNDRLMSIFAGEYAKEVERLNELPTRRLAEKVDKLMDGGSVGFADLGYRLDTCHIGIIAVGAGAELVCRNISERLCCDLLLVPRSGEDAVWAWLGAPRRIHFGELAQAAEKASGVRLAAGEPRDGLEGWRLTHREAQGALVVTLMEPPRLTRFSDVALLAAALHNEATGESLIHRYLKPLDETRDGAALRETLRTYLDLGCNAASAASALGVDRHTVQRRLRKVEEQLDEPLFTCRAELEVALRFERLTASAAEIRSG
jgi:hypothetical protein